MAKKLRGRENIRGAKDQAVAEAAEFFFKDPRTIWGYLKAAKPLQELELAFENAAVTGAASPRGQAKALAKTIADALKMLSFIQQHLTDAERARFAHLEVIDVYDIARMKAGMPLTDARSRKTKKSTIKNYPV